MADRISVTLALHALADQCEVVQECVDRLDHEYAVRNRLIRDAREGGVPYRRLTQITGLSRDRLVTIVNSPDRLDDEG